MEEKTSGMAIAALILGILSILIGWIPILGWLIVLVGLILGIVALVKISKNENLKGKGLAIAGVVLSGLALFFFVILIGIGLLLSFSHSIFESGTEKTTGIFEATSLETLPDAENPLTLPDTVSVKAKGKKTMNVGYYNLNPSKAENAKLGIFTCQDEIGMDIEAIAERVDSTADVIMPTITSAWQTIECNESKGYKIIIADNGLPSGKLYICTVVVYNNDEVDYPSEINPDVINKRCADFVDCPVYQTKQIFLQIAT